MTKYSVKQLSQLAGISVRTLHHYDQINLLIPSFRSEKGYRFYERKELLLLQQIILYRELGFPLKEIHEIIYDPSFDLVIALESHRKKMEEQFFNIKEVLTTIDKTIFNLKNKENMLTDEEIYKGLNKEEIRVRRAEVVERWGKEKLENTENRIRAMGKKGWEDLQKKGEEINQLLADLMDSPLDSSLVQKAVDLHFRHLNAYTETSKERYLALGKMYTEDERFKNHYEKYRAGLADFIHQAIIVYCKRK